MLRMKINSRKILTIYLIIIGLLLVVSLMGQISKFYLGYGTLKGIVPAFNLDEEANIPTWFSSFVLVLCAFLTGLITLRKKNEKDPYTLYWKGLVIVFLFLSIDENARIHEKFMSYVGDASQISDFFFFSWVIPGAVAVILFCLIYIKFLVHLPTNIRMLFILAGSLYIGGALLFEMINGFYVSHNSNETFSYVLLTHMEETLELVGMGFFMYSLLRYLSHKQQKFEIAIDFKK